MKEPIVIPVVHELHVVMGTKGFGRPLVTVWESGHEFPIILLKSHNMHGKQPLWI